MFTKDLKGHLTLTQMLVPGSKANTAGATSTGLDTRSYDGDLMIEQNIGAVTGSIIGTIEDSADNSSFATPAAGAISFTNVASSNNIQTVLVDKRAVRRYIRYVGTVTTGPIVMSVTAVGIPKSI